MHRVRSASTTSRSSAGSVRLAHVDLELLRCALAEAAPDYRDAAAALRATPQRPQRRLRLPVALPADDRYLRVCVNAVRAHIGARPVDDTARARRLHARLLRAA